MATNYDKFEYDLIQAESLDDYFTHLDEGKNLLPIGGIQFDDLPAVKIGTPEAKDVREILEDLPFMLRNIKNSYLTVDLMPSGIAYDNTSLNNVLLIKLDIVNWFELLYNTAKRVDLVTSIANLAQVRDKTEELNEKLTNYENKITNDALRDAEEQLNEKLTNYENKTTNDALRDADEQLDNADNSTESSEALDKLEHDKLEHDKLEHDKLEHDKLEHDKLNAHLGEESHKEDEQAKDGDASDSDQDSASDTPSDDNKPTSDNNAENQTNNENDENQDDTANSDDENQDNSQNTDSTNNAENQTNNENDENQDDTANSDDENQDNSQNTDSTNNAENQTNNENDENQDNSQNTDSTNNADGTDGDNASSELDDLEKESLPHNVTNRPLSAKVQAKMAKQEDKVQQVKTASENAKATINPESQANIPSVKMQTPPVQVTQTPPVQDTQTQLLNKMMETLNLVIKRETKKYEEKQEPKAVSKLTPKERLDKFRSDQDQLIANMIAKQI